MLTILSRSVQILRVRLSSIKIACIYNQRCYKDCCNCLQDNFGIFSVQPSTEVAKISLHFLWRLILSNMLSLPLMHEFRRLFLLILSTSCCFFLYENDICFEFLSLSNVACTDEFSRLVGLKKHDSFLS